MGSLFNMICSFTEKRTHGAGFYDFAKDEESRQEQLKALDELRNQVSQARY